MRRFLIIAIISLFVSSLANAHSGGTDSNGGHRDSSTGEYHYHHGYSAHQHTNGVCPYDFDNKIEPTSASSSAEDRLNKAIEKAKQEKANQEISSGSNSSIVSNETLYSLYSFKSFSIILFVLLFIIVISNNLNLSEQNKKLKREISSLNNQLSDSLCEQRRLSSHAAFLAGQLKDTRNELFSTNQKLLKSKETITKLHAAEQQAKMAEALKNNPTIEWYPSDYNDEQIKNVQKKRPSG